MASNNALEAVYKKLIADTALIGYLNAGANGIMVAGRATPGMEVPFITVADLPEVGSGYGDYYNSPVRVRVYTATRDGTSFYEAGRIIQRIKVLLNKNDLGTVTGGFLECRWAGVVSQALYDFNLSFWYRELRFNIAMALAIAN